MSENGEKQNTSDTPDPELFDALSELGWHLSQDPDIRDISLALYAQLAENERAAIILSSRTHGQLASQWAEKVSPWEKSFSADLVKQQRLQFLQSCFSRAVSKEFQQDSQLRWEKAEFSSVSEKFIVIGDVYSHNLVGYKQLKKEVVCSSNIANIGRKYLTQDVWKKISENAIHGIKPKINGERFYLKTSRKQISLCGFKTLEIKEKHFIPQIVDYYAGEYYVYYPHTEKDLVYNVIENGREKKIIFRACPLYDIDEYQYFHEYNLGHKYDGIILCVNDMEYKTKWIPSVTANVNGEDWEMILQDSKPSFLYPRYGVPGIKFENVKDFIWSTVPSNILLDSLAGKQSFKYPEKNSPKNSMIGVKCAFVSNIGELVVIREPEKQLDLIGGRVELGETFIRALIREVKEETGADMSESDFLYLGSTEENGRDSVWTSHVFFAVAPPKVLFSPYVEKYTFDWSFSYYSKSSLGRPWQAWYERHLKFLSQYFDGLLEMRTAAFLLWDAPRPHAISVKACLFDLIREQYVKKLRSKGEGVVKLAIKGYYLPPEVQKDLGFAYHELNDSSRSVEELRKLWKEILFEPSERFSLRSTLRLLGCSWSDGEIGKILALGIDRGVLIKKGTKFSIT